MVTGVMQVDLWPAGMSPRKAVRPSAGVWPLARPLKVSSRARVSRLAMVKGAHMRCNAFTDFRDGSCLDHS